MSERGDKLKATGIRKYGSEELWRKALSDGAKKADRTTPRGFAVIDPELHKEFSSRGGKKSRRTKTGDTKK